jgi:polar amino acid transport system permease protein
MSIDDILFLLKGTLVTVEISIIGLIGGVFVGFIMGLGQVSRNILINTVARVYSAFFRSIPIMTWLFLIFFGIPLFTGLTVPLLVSIGMAFTLWAGAYMSEIVKAGIEAVPDNQWKASKSLGMNYIQQMYYVILPQIVKIVLPPATGFFVGLIKDTSTAYILACRELLRAGRLVGQRTTLFFPVLLMVAAIYFIICYPLSLYTQRLERKRRIN